MAADNRRIVVSKKNCSEQDDMKADPISTDRITSPIQKPTDRFISPLEATAERFTAPLEGTANRFTSPLKESTSRFTSHVDDRFTSPMKEKRRTKTRWSQPYQRSRSPPPVKDELLSPLRDSYNLREDSNRNLSSDYYRRNRPLSPLSKERQLSPPRDFRDDNNRSQPSDYYRRRSGSPPSVKERRLSPSRDSYNNFREDSNRSRLSDYYRRSRSPPPLKDRRLSPQRDSYNFKDDNRLAPYNSAYDKDDFNTQQSSGSENIISNLNVAKRPCLDATILITSNQLMSYAVQIERRLKNLNMTTEILVVPDSVQQNEMVEQIAKEGVLYVIIVNSQNKAHHSLTLHIFQGTPQEHRNMPSDDAMSLVARNFERYLQVLKEQNAARAAKAALPPPSLSSTPQSTLPPPPPSSVQSMDQSQTVTIPSSHPAPPPNPDPNATSPNQPGLPFLPPSSELSYLFNLLADCRYLTLQELDKVLNYLNNRKHEFLQSMQTNASKGAGDFSSGDDLQRMDKDHPISTAPLKVDYQSKILSMIMPSNMPDNRNPNVNNSFQQNVHNLPDQPMRNMDMMPKDDQDRQSMGANNSSNMKALINFDNPTVQKAVENLMQSGPSLLQNINAAMSKNTNNQQLPPNSSLDRNQMNYNQYGLPQSMDHPGPQMMSHMSGGRGGGVGRGRDGHGDVRPNMPMSEMNRDSTGYTSQSHFNRDSGMFPNNPHMNRGPPNLMSRPPGSMTGSQGLMTGLNNNRPPQQY